MAAREEAHHILPIVYAVIHCAKYAGTMANCWVSFMPMNHTLMTSLCVHFYCSRVSFKCVVIIITEGNVRVTLKYDIEYVSVYKADYRERLTSVR